MQSPLLKNQIAVIIIARICSKVNRKCHVIVTLFVRKTLKIPRKFSKFTNGKNTKSSCGSKENSILDGMRLISLLGFPSREGGFDSRTLLQEKDHPTGVVFLLERDKGRESNRFYAARMSAAGDGWTEPIND